MKLAELQRQILAAACGRQPDADLLARVQAAGGIDGRRRLRAYADTVRATHRETLEQAYPVCVEVVGRRYWRLIAAPPDGREGSAERDLARHGADVPRRLAAALANRAELAGYDYLPDLARLEWRVHRARYAADDPAFDFEAFAARDDRDDLRLLTSASLAQGSSPWAVDELWRAHREDGGGGEVAAAATHYSVHRGPGFEVSVDSLTVGDAELLDAVRGGAALSTLERLPGIDGALATKIYDWIMRGWIVGFAETGSGCSTTTS